MSDLCLLTDQELLSSSSASSSMLEVNENKTSAAITSPCYSMSPFTLSLNNCRNSAACQTFRDNMTKEHNAATTSLNLSSSGSSSGFDWKIYAENEKNDQ